MRTCEVCGVSIEVKHVNAKFCSNKCRRAKWRQANREKEMESGRKWREANPDYSLKYYKANRESYRQRGLKWRQANPEKKKVTNRQYYENNIQENRTRVRKNRNKKAAAVHMHQFLSAIPEIIKLLEENNDNIQS